MTNHTIAVINNEIERGNLKHGAAPLANDIEKAVILAEELGEFAAAAMQGRTADARRELIQLAAVAINRLEETGPHFSSLK